MAAILPMVISGAAGVALTVSLWQIGTRVRALESQRNDFASTGAASAPGERSSKPMLAALYREPSPSPLSGLTSLPGGAWLGAALALAIVSLSLSGFAPSKVSAVPAAPDSNLVRLQGRVDSLGLVVAGLRDSVRVVAATAEPARRPATTPSKPTSRPERSVLAAPPAPVP